MAFIELKNVGKYYNNNGNITIGLRNINLELNRGEIVAIIGDSGSGKSTLLNVITGVDTYEDGEMLFNGSETSYFNQNDMDMYRKQHVGFIFQNYNIIESYTVLQNVMIPMLINGIGKKEAKQRAVEILAKVGLSDRLKHRGTKLSGGEKQRCVIARALASDCEILACDEPTGNLDSETGAEIIRLIQEVAKDKLVLIVTHNYEQVKDIITRSIKISDGEVLEDRKISEPLPVSVEAGEAVSKDNFHFTSYFRFAIQNILSTPKKTIFISAVFLAISFVAILMVLFIFQYSYNNGYTSFSPYIVEDERHILVYDKENKPLDKQLLEKCGADVIHYNAFYENISFNIHIKKNAKDSGTLSVYYTPYDVSESVLYGRKPQADGEYFLIVPDTMDGRDDAFYYTGDATPYLDGVEKGKMVGAGISSKVQQTLLYSYTDISEQVEKTIFKNLVVPYYKDGDEFVRMEMVIGSLQRSYISVPKQYENIVDTLEFKFMLNDLYPCRVDVPIEISNTEDGNIFFYKSNSVSLSVEMEEIYEASIYTSRPNRVLNYLHSHGMNTTQPSRMFHEDSLTTLVTFYSFSVLVVLALIFLSFITYIILFRVYSSKNKDYTVLRSLGLIKSKMKNIVIIETVFQALLASALSLIIMKIIYYASDKQLLTMVKFADFSVILLSLAIMVCFGYFLARRFNRRLFRFSVSTSLKGEVVRND